MRYLVLNGPNLDLLGTREPGIYGSMTLHDVEDQCVIWAAELGDSVECHQSNHEGTLIERIHASRDRVDGIVLNAGAYTHTSYAIHDAITAVGIPTVEVHISNVMEREPWRRESRIRPACIHAIYGRGTDGYHWALRHLHHRLATPPTILAYGDHPDQVGDLRLPDGPGPHPLAVVVHGGFWKHQWTRDTVDGIAVDLTGRGVATWVPEYRRVGTGGGPGTIDDVRDAVAFVSGRDDIDRSRMVLVGHSAGGHLALLAARNVGAAAVVGLAPVSDLGEAASAGLGSDAVRALIPDGPLDDWDPIRRLPLGVPQVVVHGDEDDSVPITMSDHYVAEAEAAGDEVEYLRLEATGHMDLIDPAKAAWARARTAILDHL
jgi:3-dehydroquinate dehydratase type II